MPEPTGGPRTHRLRVVEVIAETADARSLVLQAPPESADRFAYRPGQFLTLKLPGADGSPAARCYSSPARPTRASPEDHRQAGRRRLRLQLGLRPDRGRGRSGGAAPAAPSPRLPRRRPAARRRGQRHHPVLSIAKSALAEGRGRVVLLYANRDESSVVFREELRALTEDHPHRLLVVHWLESLQGLPSVDRLAAALAPYADREAFVCGPQPLMDAVEQALRALGAPGDRIHRERFFSLGADVFDVPAVPVDAAGEDTATAEVELDGETRTVAWPPTVPLLDVLLAAGVDAPYSCREGACSACTCRVVAGEVKMLRNDVLDDQDIAEGYVLACQALPLGDRVEITYS
ncbi:2Fe-2S iron-sulfur cluster-binding protein [Streptomyces diastatochromogenes]|nr:2Fe-2S iron-sulfur cluster-binding protein [Streptomyces diastatochromogenes]